MLRTAKHAISSGGGGAREVSGVEPLPGGFRGLRGQAVREHDFALLGQRFVGASADGIVMETALDMRVGEAVLVSLRLPRTGRWVDAEATVNDLDSMGAVSGLHTVSLGIVRVDGPSDTVVELLGVLEDCEGVLA